MQRTYTWDVPNQRPSQPTDLRQVMRKARRYVKGHDLTVINGQWKHPHLSAFGARKLLRAILEKVEFDREVDVRGPNHLLFSVTRVRPNPYMDPFRDAVYSSARIDAGVDYCSRGPIHPIGRAKITAVGVPSHTSTFGEKLSIYQLLDGPAKGKYVFFAEHYKVKRHFRKGQTVDTDAVLYDTNGCIEIGWSDGHGSMAWDIDNNIEGQRTAWGQNMSDLLESLGTKPGLTQGLPITMKLPAGWPTW